MNKPLDPDAIPDTAPQRELDALTEPNPAVPQFALRRPFRAESKRSPAKFDPKPWLLRHGASFHLLNHVFGLCDRVLGWRLPVLVSRNDDVREVLARQDVFHVPYEERMRELDPTGTNFILGMNDGDEYKAGRRRLMQVLRLADVVPRIAEESARQAEECLGERAEGQVNAAACLLWTVPTRLCRSYFGIPIATDQEHDFALWTMAMSDYTFVPSKDAETRELALAGAERVAHLIHLAIVEARDNPGRDTIVERLIDLQKREPAGAFTDAMMVASLTGVITGFIPTVAGSSTNALAVLLKRPKALAMAQTAAREGRDDFLERCIFEAMRFNYVPPVLFRKCSQDTTLLGTGHGYGKVIRRGSVVVALKQSAMFDRRTVKTPGRFDPQRPASDYLLLGHGVHWCMGAAIARAQITQTLKPLLARGNVRAAPGAQGRTTFFGPFREHMLVQFGGRRS